MFTFNANVIAAICKEEGATTGFEKNIHILMKPIPPIEDKKVN
jgi:hypothetical protein